MIFPDVRFLGEIDYLGRPIMDHIFDEIEQRRIYGQEVNCILIGSELYVDLMQRCLLLYENGKGSTLLAGVPVKITDENGASCISFA